jgi:hypothetical protein
VPTDRLRSAAADDRSQGESNDDRVIGIADDRYEVGHQVDGQGKVGQQQPESNANTTRKRGIPGKPREKAKQIRQKTYHVLKPGLLWRDNAEGDDQPCPQHQQPSGKRDEDPYDHPRMMTVPPPDPVTRIRGRGSSH